jgi:hypothetical protein
VSEGLPDFRSEAFLRAHIAATMAFYHSRAIDPRGGFCHYFRDDGTVYDSAHRHLVSSTHFAVPIRDARCTLLLRMGKRVAACAS